MCSRLSLCRAELVRAQIRSVLSDIGADVIKIGMLGSAEIIEVVAEEIEESDAFIILDPVMVATSGDTLLEDKAIETLKTKLLPLADLVTPNVPEAALLTGLKIDDVDDLTKAGDALLKMNVYAALMKGGHLEGKSVVDVLVSEEGRKHHVRPAYSLASHPRHRLHAGQRYSGLYGAGRAARRSCHERT